MTGATIDYLDESSLDDDLEVLAATLAPRPCKDPTTKARTIRIERKIGFSVPETHRADLHMAVMYCHEELESRRNEQRFPDYSNSRDVQADHARAYTYRRREHTNPADYERRPEREYFSGCRIIGVDTRDSGLRPDHAALGCGSVWLGYHAEDY
jgi:hypothetical protein